MYRYGMIYDFRLFVCLFVCLLMNFGKLLASHKFETERYQRMWNILDFLIFFVLFSNLHARMMV